MLIELSFLAGGLALTVVLGVILVPIVRQALREDQAEKAASERQ